jgi:hypothetical protein
MWSRVHALLTDLSKGRLIFRERDQSVYDRLKYNKRYNSSRRRGASGVK